MVLRPLQRADGDRLLALWNRNARFDALSPELLEEKLWGDEAFDPERALVAEAEGEAVGFVLGVARTAGAVRRGYVKMIVVDGPRQRAGLGSRLLTAVEAALWRHDVTSIRLFESVPNYLTPGLDRRYAEARRFFEKHGYERFGETCNLDVDLGADDFSTAEQERALARHGIVVRRAREADQDAVAAFLEEHWPDWQAEGRQSFSNAPVSLHLALDRTVILGFAAYDTNNRTTGWFGPMGTAARARGRGIGGVLLRRCLRDMKARGWLRAIIPWVGPVDFYARHAGASVSRVFDRYQKTRP